MKKMRKTDLAKLVKEVSPVERTVSYGFDDGQEINVKIKPNMGIIEMTSIIDSVVSVVFVGDSYHPYLKDVLFWYFILKTVTDLPIGELFANDENGTHLDADVLNTVYVLIGNTNICDDVADTIGGNAFWRFSDYLESAIEFKKTELVQSKSSFDRFMNSLTSLTDSLEEVAEKMKDVNVDEIKSVVGKIGSIDQNKIIDFMTAKLAKEEK